MPPKYLLTITDLNLGPTPIQVVNREMTREMVAYFLDYFDSISGVTGEPEISKLVDGHQPPNMVGSQQLKEIERLEQMRRL